VRRLKYILLINAVLKVSEITLDIAGKKILGAIICDNSYKKIQQDATVYQNFISDLHEAQQVSCDTPPIIRSPKLH